jgi:hypothetical protein
MTRDECWRRGLTLTESQDDTPKYNKTKKIKNNKETKRTKLLPANFIVAMCSTALLRTQFQILHTQYVLQTQADDLLYLQLHTVGSLIFPAVKVFISLAQ